tara:strand:- start:463 stop:999 length:537 start_codon:yes stop_codon:yes gene_type:complete
MKKNSNYLLRSLAIIVFIFFGAINLAIADIPLPPPEEIELGITASPGRVTDSGLEPDLEYDEETARLTDEEIERRSKYESIEEEVTSRIGEEATVTAGTMAETIATVAAIFGVDVKVDYDKKSGLSCFSIDSSGNVLNVVSCSDSGTVLSSCDATAADDWKSGTISCTGFELTATVVE